MGLAPAGRAAGAARKPVRRSPAATVPCPPRAALRVRGRAAEYSRAGSCAGRKRSRSGSLATQKLGRQTDIGLGARRAKIVEQHRLAVARRFADPDIAWDHRFVDRVAEETSRVV